MKKSPGMCTIEHFGDQKEVQEGVTFQSHIRTICLSSILLQSPEKNFVFILIQGHILPL